MSLFFEQPATAAMIRQAESIPASLRQLLPLLARHPISAEVPPLPEMEPVGSGIDIYLRDFRGDVPVLELVLEDVDGNTYVKRDFAGQVTLVNFWASWCAPCIEEIPSLNRLKQKMAGRPFELISINYAEQRDTVAEFLRRVEVEFPVLMDFDGRYAEAWNVISYPSTFVIDTHGRITYGVNAAIDWDDPQLIERLEALME
jgi:thiol-disulfide isomerase/thioredoxin